MSLIPRLILPAVLFLLVASPGCKSTPADTATFRALDLAWKQVGPEYRRYVLSDPALSDETKVTRTRTADLIDKALATALESAPPAPEPVPAPPPVPAPIPTTGPVIQ